VSGWVARLSRGAQEETCQQQKSEKGTDVGLVIQKSKLRGMQQTTSANSQCLKVQLPAPLQYHMLRCLVIKPSRPRVF